MPQSQLKVPLAYPAQLENHGDNHSLTKIPLQPWPKPAADSEASGCHRLGTTCPTYSGFTAAGPLTG